MSTELIRIELTPTREELKMIFDLRGLLPECYRIDGMVSQIVSLMLVPVKEDEAQDE